MSDLTVVPAPYTPPIIILDQHGQPLQSRPVQRLSESDRDKPGMVGYDSYLLNTFPLARWTPDALILHKGYPALYEMRNDAIVRMALDLKLQATMYKPWELLPAVQSEEEEEQEGDFELADQITKFCYYVLCNIRNRESGRRTPFRTIMWNILQAVAYGFSVQDMQWRHEDEERPYAGSWVLQSITPRRCEQIGFELDRNTLEVLNLVSWTPLGGRQKKSVSLEQCILYTYKGMHGLPYGNGDLRACYRFWWSKENALRWWGVALKRWGVPLWEIIVNSGNMIPKSLAVAMKVEQGAALSHTREEEWKPHFAPGGTLDTYATFFRYCDANIIQNIIGNTLTTTQGDGSSSYALGQTHQTSQNFFLAYPRHDLEDVINMQVLERAVEYEFGKRNVRLTPRFSLGHWDNAERMGISEQVSEWVEAGVVNGQEPWVRKLLDIPPFPKGFKPNPDLVSLVPGRERIDVQTDGKGKPIGKPGAYRYIEPRSDRKLFQWQRHRHHYDDQGNILNEEAA